MSVEKATDWDRPEEPGLLWSVTLRVPSEGRAPTTYGRHTTGPSGPPVRSRGLGGGFRGATQVLVVRTTNGRLTGDGTTRKRDRKSLQNRSEGKRHAGRGLGTAAGTPLPPP